MAILGKGAQPTDARPWVQALVWMLLCSTLALLPGCSSVPSAINPVTWWHSMEGGEIAKQRPPPPGNAEPYPNLATVPPRPAAPNQQQLASITQSLVADRAHADYVAASTPVADPSSPSASPSLFGQGTMPPPPPAAPPAAPGMASASLPAASAPSAPAGPPPASPPPKSAPLRPVQSAPLAPPPQPARPATTAAATPQGTTPAAAAPSPTTAAPAPAGSTPSATALASAAPAPANAPPLPSRPPAPPALTGAGAPMAQTAPPQVASNAVPARPMPANATRIEFVTGSATLPAGAAAVLKDVAAKRGGATIAVTGYGDAASSDPSAQTAALSLALSRAQAVANVLTGDGVPQAAVRVGAEAAGRGASVRLVQ